jgi:hypothetical protein
MEGVFVVVGVREGVNVREAVPVVVGVLVLVAVGAACAGRTTSHSLPR